MTEKTEHTYRYERKYFVEGMSRAQILQSIRLNPAMFREIYHERWINNIYFDTLDFKNYFDNEAGVMHRTKYRIRWYGELFGENKKPVLELKIKQGLGGRKDNFPLPKFTFDKNFSADTVREVAEKAYLPDEIKSNLLGNVPAIVNRYKRKYFLSADGNFRLTVDSSLFAARVGRRNNSFLDQRLDEEHFVVELKYHPENDRDAIKLTDAFPFRMSKSSKYASSVEKLYSF